MGWDETGITTWDEEHLRLRPIGDIFLPLVKAVIERHDIEYVKAYWDNLDPYLVPYIEPEGFKREIFVEMDDLVVGEWGLDDNPNLPTWVNYTDNGGNWHKKDEVPYWDKAGILAAIGQSEYIRYQPTVVQYQPPLPGAPVQNVPVSELQPLPSIEWIIQIYKMLNLFRWTSTSANAFTGINHDVKQKYAEGADYATASGLWPVNYSDEISNKSTRVTADDNQTSGLIELLRQYTEDDTYQFISPYRSQDRATAKYDATIYVVPEAYGVFDAHGDDILEDKLAEVRRVVGKNDYNLPWSYIGSANFTDGVPNDPGANAATGWRIETDGEAVVEWDVTDGFEYVTELT